MLLFDSLHMASTAMNASQLGMQVAGQNLTNAKTSGYVREQLILESGASRKLGSGVLVGTGVSVAGVSQVIDNFLEERLRNATSDAYSSATQQKYYSQLEAVLNELTDSDLSSSLEAFFNSIDNIQNHPENVTYREMAVDQGVKLAEDINRIALTITEMQRDINNTVAQSADQINLLLKEIQDLNTNISLLESGNSQEALGLRDSRLDAMNKLSALINIKSTEDAKTGMVTIYCGSDLLLMDGIRNEIHVGSNKANDGEVAQTILCIRDTMTPLDVRGGNVKGLYEAHETILGGYLSDLDEFSADLVEQFNKVFSSGQGMTGYTQLRSPVQLENPDIPLNAAGLDWSISNGTVSVQVYDTKTKTTVEYPIKIDVSDTPASDPFSLKPAPQADGTSLNQFAEAINNIEGISARVTVRGELEITVDNPDLQFSFANDQSGILSALGMNTFFSGTTAATIGVNQVMVEDPSKFAASLGGIGHDVDNGVKLAAMGVNPNAELGGKSIVGYYEGIVSSVMLAGGKVKSIAASDSLYQQSLQTQRDSISGVNIDEETILMMTYQRMFQANSKFVSMVNEMLDTLMAL